MTKLSFIRLVPLLLLVASQAAAQNPKPDSAKKADKEAGKKADEKKPEEKKPATGAAKLALFEGNWKYEGDAQATPLGPAAKVSGNQKGKLVANDNVLQWQGKETGVFGEVEWGETDVYDAAGKRYQYLGYQEDGTVWSGAWTVTGNVWKASGTITAKGVRYSYRQTMTIAEDGKSATWKADVSSDGKSWVAWTKGTMSK
jgi:hypothetical protein